MVTFAVITDPFYKVAIAAVLPMGAAIVMPVLLMALLASRAA